MNWYKDKLKHYKLMEEKEKISRKKYYQNNKEILKLKSKIWYKKNRIKILKIAKEKYEEFSKLKKEKLKKYQRNYQRLYRKRRRKEDIGFKMKDYLSIRIRSALKNNHKAKHTAELIGCSIEYLKQYLENKFRRGMSWKNWNRKGWHIDHIKPCCSFDLSKKSEQLKCFNYKNLQPLWAKENYEKGRKYLK